MKDALEAEEHSLETCMARKLRRKVVMLDNPPRWAVWWEWMSFVYLLCALFYPMRFNCRREPVDGEERELARANRRKTRALDAREHVEYKWDDYLPLNTLWKAYICDMLQGTERLT